MLDRWGPQQRQIRPRPVLTTASQVGPDGVMGKREPVAAVPGMGKTVCLTGRGWWEAYSPNLT